VACRRLPHSGHRAVFALVINATWPACAAKTPSPLPGLSGLEIQCSTTISPRCWCGCRTGCRSLPAAGRWTGCYLAQGQSCYGSGNQPPCCIAAGMRRQVQNLWNPAVLFHAWNSPRSARSVDVELSGVGEQGGCVLNVISGS